MNEPTYCKSCGAYIPTGQKKCLACGFPTEIPPLVDSEFESMRSHAGGKRLCDASKWQEKADIDLDALMDMTFFTVKIGGVVSKYYFGDYQRAHFLPTNEIELGRTINGRIIRGGQVGTKHMIDFKLIER